MKRTRMNAAGRRADAEYGRLLLAKQAELLAELEEAKFDLIASLGRVAEDDQAQLSHEEFISLEVNSLDYRELRLVERALERLAAGAFGICQSCNQPISAKRLDALPWAQFCVSCQEMLNNPQPTEMEPAAAE